MFRQPPGPAARSVGLGRPRAGGLTTAAAVCVGLLLVVPVFAKVTADSPTFLPGWWRLLPGLFAQAGIAEEVLFRGYLFGRLRKGRSFWRAAGLSILPFAAVHLVLFSTMPWSIALAALMLSVVLSDPTGASLRVGREARSGRRHSFISSCKAPSRSSRSLTPPAPDFRFCGWQPARSCRCRSAGSSP